MQAGSGYTAHPGVAWWADSKTQDRQIGAAPTYAAEALKAG